MIKLAILAALPLLLVACVSQQQRQAETKAQWAKVENNIDARCTQYGFKPGTDAHANCRVKLLEMVANDMQAREIAQAQVNAQANAARSQALMATGQAMMQSAQPRPMTTTNCRRNIFGSVDCTSF